MYLYHVLFEAFVPEVCQLETYPVQLWFQLFHGEPAVHCPGPQRLLSAGGVPDPTQLLSSELVQAGSHPQDPRVLPAQHPPPSTLAVPHTGPGSPRDNVEPEEAEVLLEELIPRWMAQP